MSIQHTLVALALVSLPLASLGCESATKDKSMARGGDAVAVNSAASSPAAGASYKFSNADSKVEFVGAKITGKHNGSFGAFTGNINVPGGDATKGSVTVTIDMKSIAADDPKLTGHLKSPDFFDVEKFPEAKFTSASIKAGGDKGASHTVTGNLELHGVTKSISFPATIKTGVDAVEVNAEFGINRKDFGVVYPGKPDDLIKDEVLLKLTIKAPKG